VDLAARVAKRQRNNILITRASNNSNSSWGDNLNHPYRRFFFAPKFSALEYGFVDGRATNSRTEPHTNFLISEATGRTGQVTT
jgi:hypothetical protein